VGVAVNARRPFMVRGKWMILGLAIVAVFALAGSYGWAKEEGKEEGKEEAKAKVELPEAAAKALKDAFPTATIDEVEAEDEDGVKVFAVELKQGEEEMEVEVAADGTILSVETEIELKDVPEAAAKVINKAAEGGKVEEVKKEEIRAEVKDKKIVKLDKAKIVYEAEIEKGDQEGTIEVAADGTVVEQLKWKTKEKEEEEGKKDGQEK